MYKATVIIPNWNGRELLPDCLSSLKRQSFKNFNILVVDNGSTDDSLSYIRENFPDVEVVFLKRNYGFSRAINEGVKKSSSKYTVFLNNDTEVDKKWLENLIKVADKHPEVVSVGSKILNFYRRDKIDGVGILINEVGQARSVGYEEKDGGQFDDEAYIFGATGGAALFRRDLFLRLGGFDERYFMYFEEVDFAFRAQFAGYKSVYAPKAVCLHKHKASSKRVPQKIEYWQFRNMTQTIIKDFPKGVVLRRWRWLKITLVHLNTILYQLKNGFYWPPFVTELWLLFHLPMLLMERSRIQRSRIVADEYIESFLLPKRVTFWGFKR